MSGPAVVLDACVLIPIRLATTLLWLAEAGLFQPLWSATILDEARRNLPHVGVTPQQATRRVTLMQEAFGVEALVDGYDALIDQMTCHPKDGHVLAAAVHAEADAVVTFNLKDFPDEAVDAHEVKVLHPDTFLVQLLGQHPDTVLAAVEREVGAFRNPPQAVEQFLATLTATVPVFANLAADALSDPPVELAPEPALVAADEDKAIAALGEPGDFTNPAQVAFAWWSALLHDGDLARNLTYDPSAWGDYEWAVTHLAGRSLASKVIRAVDAPGDIAFMRFVPAVAGIAQVFEPYLTQMTFLTLVEVGDGTWRVWGLGPNLRSAKAIRGG